MQTIVHNLEEFKEISKDFLEKLSKSCLNTKTATVVGLFGDLGAGKTTFVQSLGKYLGIKQKITSPTFPIMKRYPIGKAYGVWKNLYHIDAYRLEGKDISKELEILGWKEIISNPKNLVFVEWPEIIDKYLPKKYIKINIKHLKNNGRGINIVFPKS